MNFASDPGIDAALERARALAAQAQDEAAKAAYLEILRNDPTHFFALNELAGLALAGGFRSAARTAYLQAVRHHPDNPVARVNLANLLRQDNDVEGARLHYEHALGIDPQLHEAHQGMAWVLNELGLEGAERHWHKGYSGHAVVTVPYRGTGRGVPLLLLVSARGGNIPTRPWISDRQFAVSAIHAEFWDSGMPLPPHALIVNAIGDADLCAAALAGAEEIAARSGAPVIRVAIASASISRSMRSDNRSNPAPRGRPLNFAGWCWFMSANICSIRSFAPRRSRRRFTSVRGRSNWCSSGYRRRRRPSFSSSG